MTDDGGIFAIIERAKRSPATGVYVMVGLSLYITPAVPPRTLVTALSGAPWLNVLTAAVPERVRWSE